MSPLTTCELELDLKTMIIEVLNLEDLTPAEIDSENPIFGEGLGLDSIDALELGIAIQKRYGVKFNSQTDDVRTHFATVRNLAKFILASREGAEA